MNPDWIAFKQTSLDEGGVYMELVVCSCSCSPIGKVSTHFCEPLGGEENWRQPDAQHVQLQDGECKGLYALSIGSALRGTRTTGLFLP